MLANVVCFAAKNPADVFYDVIVIGGGASGTSAALSAAQNGSNVLLIEKGREIGASQFSSGMMGVNTSLQKKYGMKITPMEVFHQMEDYTHLMFNARLARMAVEESATTIDWLMDNGAKIWLPVEPQQFAHDAAEPIIYHMWNSHQGVSAIGKSFLKAGGTVMLRTTGKDLIKNTDGTIGGVVAETEDGKILRIKSKAVIIATGGFMGNKDMMEKAGIVGHPMGWLFNDGSGLKMAWKAGAAKYKDKVTQYHGTGIVTEDNKESIYFPKLESLIHIPLLWVDKSGQRYYNEDYVYDNALVSHALVSIGGTGYVVFDQAMVDYFKKHKTGMIDSFANIRQIKGKQAGPLPNLEKDLNAAIAEKTVFKANTLEKLAEQVGFQKDNFVKQVNDYNGYVKTGVDKQFDKKSEHLVYSVKKGPFYAVKVTTYNLTTVSGIKVNEKLEAVDSEFNQIPGLYAVGNVAGGLYSDTYMTIEGLTCGFATTSGRMAGIHSSEYVKSLK